MLYHVPLIPQQTSRSCWAASMAMILSWARRQSVDPQAILADGRYAKQYAQGLHPEDTLPLTEFGFALEAPACYGVPGFLSLLQQYGPLWVAAAPDLDGNGTPDPHIRVATGLSADPDPKRAVVHVNDPWQRGMKAFSQPNRGSRYTESYARFASLTELLGSKEMDIARPIYVAHLARRPHTD